MYESGMEGDAQRRTSLRNELSKASPKIEFELYFQPHIETYVRVRQRLRGAGALAASARGLLGPQQFIPFAEQTGFIREITGWMVEKSAAQYALLRDRGLDLKIAVNLSTRDLMDLRLADKLERTLARSGLEPSVRFGLEITESAMMDDPERAPRTLQRLDAMGHHARDRRFRHRLLVARVSQALPLHQLKIDRSFVSGLLTDPHDATIADMIITIAARFGFESLAEGVEQLGEIGWLRERACRYMQGYAICHPLPLIDFKAWLVGHRE